MTANNPPLNQQPIKGYPWTQPWHRWFNELKNVIFGSGTSGTMAKFTGTAKIGDSIYTETELKAKLRDYTATDWTYTGDDLTGVSYNSGDLVETRSYNGYGHISTRVFTGDLTETWTYTYNSSNDKVSSVEKS